jgi:hypothetical protein
MTRPTRTALLLLLVLPLLLQGATLTHSHEPGNPGLYNQEHDFSLYAVSGAAVLPDTVAALVAFVIAVSVYMVAAPRPRELPCAAGDPRAPPAR